MRKVIKMPLLCDNEGCNKHVGYWMLFEEYKAYYTGQVRRNGTFYCYRCYHAKQEWLKDNKKASKDPLPAYFK